MTPIRIPCPLCAGTGNHTLGGGRDNRMDRCSLCGGEGTIDAATGLTREASHDGTSAQPGSIISEGGQQIALSMEIRQVLAASLPGLSTSDHAVVADLIASGIVAAHSARSHIVTLGGDPGDEPDGDHVQAAVLSSVDAALTRTKPERNGVAETDVVAKAKQLCAETCSPKDTGDGKHSCPDCTAEFYGEWITDARAALAQTPPPPATGRVDVAGGVPSEEEIAAAIRANVVARWMGSDSFVEGFEEAAHAVLALLTPDHPAGDDAGTGRAA